MQTLDRLVSARAECDPDRPFVRLRGSDLTYGAAEARASALAANLRACGVEAGQHVAIMLGNCEEFVLTFLAVARLGAVLVPINTRARGALLVHQLTLTPAAVLVIDGALLSLLDDHRADLAQYRTVLTCGDDPARCSLAARVQPFDDAPVLGGSGPLESEADEARPAIILFTSGTTGRSKGCVLSHRYLIRQGQLLIENLGLRPDDVLYCPFPLYHADAVSYTLLPALLMGATAALGTRFSVTGFWDEIRYFGATVFDFMGATLTMVYNLPASPADRDNPVRLAWGVPVPDFAPDFESRFGLEIVELYGSTDVGIPLFRPLDRARRTGSCGLPVSAYELRLMNSNGFEVGVGEVGEIVVRPNEPHLIAEGYFGMPEETLHSRQNLWFHTGDLARQDRDGWFYFVGRNTDTIRRRGENISAFEIEEVLRTHSDVVDVAAYGVPSELTEDDVMVCVVTRSDRSPKPAALAAYCADRMADYMVPRYIDFIDHLPMTPTEKVEKFRLVERGITATTWDRLASPASPTVDHS
jgi:carnitine-CoA ligase